MHYIKTDFHIKPTLKPVYRVVYKLLMHDLYAQRGCHKYFYLMFTDGKNDSETCFFLTLDF